MQNCCDMRGFLSFLVLRLISKEPLSGEQIRQEIKRRKGTKPSSGTIYPVLKSLSQGGLIEEIDEGGKTKRYQLTRAGQRELRRATKQFIQTFCCMKEEFGKA